MGYDPSKHHRQSIRLRDYDYSQTNPYFVTLCIQEGLFLLGDIIDGAMQLNAAGLMVEKWCAELESKFPGIKIDLFTLMPNHLHAIIVIVGSSLDMVSRFGIGLDDLDFDHADENGGIIASLSKAKGGHAGPPLQTNRMATRPRLGQMIQWFKTMSTNEYIRGVRNSDWLPFPGKLWQRNYYEHIVRDEESLNRIREYIRDNPIRWHLDRENPKRIGDDEFDLWLDELSLES